MVFSSDYAHIPTHIKKGIILPKIVYEEDTGQNYGGYYITKTREIIVVTREYFLSTISHELKHYIQDWYGDKKLDNIPWDSGNCYETAINKYFNSSWSEMEALRFEYKYSKNEINEWWLRKLVNDGIN